MITLTLPFPPTSNHLWRHAIIKGKPRIVTSKRGQKYRDSVVVQCISQRAAWKGIKGRIRMTVYMHAPDKRKRDVSNILKALEDAITHAGVWGDDSQIDDVRVVRMGVVPKEARVEVEIEEITDGGKDG